MVLNSPWFDLQAPFLIRTVGTAVLNQLGARQPMRAIPRNVTGLYTRSLHRDHDGEWDFNLAWKPVESLARLRRLAARDPDRPRPPPRRPRRALPGPGPVARTGAPTRREMGEDVHAPRHRARRRRRSAGGRPPLGRHVTVVAVEDALHDVVLSRPDVRKVVYDEIDRWVSAYVD